MNASRAYHGVCAAGSTIYALGGRVATLGWLH
jgi:hypothetical protein